MELDSMGPGSDTTMLTTLNLDDTSPETDPSHTSHSWAEINGWNAQVANGQLEGGTLTVTGGGTYVIVDNIDDFGDDSVYVSGSILVDEDKLATGKDDDAPFVPRKADISLMNTKFEPAYIVVEEATSESQLTIPFVANLGELDIEVVPATASGRSSTFETSQDFWVAQIVLCYQGKRDADHDPDEIYHFWSGADFKSSLNVGEVGILYGQTVDETSALYDNISMIFIETIRDRAAWSVFFSQPIFNNITNLLNNGDVERITVVHEVGHQFGLGHTPGLMNGIGVEDPSLEFSSADLKDIRNSTAIGQP